MNSMNFAWLTIHLKAFWRSAHDCETSLSYVMG